MLDWRRYVAVGMPVMPLKTKSKIPATKNGYLDATTDLEQCRAWFEGSNDYNIGIAMGKPWVAVDVDDPHAWQDWLVSVNQSEPETLAQRTGKGYQLIFRSPREVRNSGGRPCRGVDVRGQGGYIVVPPSIHPSGRVYEWVGGFDASRITELPDWLYETIVAPSSNEDVFADPVDVMAHVDKLAEDTDRHESLVRLAAHLAGCGYTERQIREVLEIATRNVDKERADTMRASGEFARIVQSACEKFGKVKDNEWSVDALRAGRFCESEPPKFTWIIDGLLAEGICGFVYGSGGTYKSLAALWLCMQLSCVDVSEQIWLGRYPLTHKCRSIFFSCEDVTADLHSRAYNIMQEMQGMDTDAAPYAKAINDNCLIVPREAWVDDGQPYLVDRDGSGTGKIASMVKLSRDFGAQLIVLETLSRIAPLDENDNSGAARILDAIETLRDRTGATVLVIAHTSKAARGGSSDVTGQNALRGASALLDNARFGLWFQATKRSNVIQIHNSKNFRCGRSDPFAVEVSFPRFDEHVEETDDSKASAVVAYISEHPGASQRQMRSDLSMRARDISDACAAAIDAGKIERVGGRSGGYQVVPGTTGNHREPLDIKEFC